MKKQKSLFLRHLFSNHPLLLFFFKFFFIFLRHLCYASFVKKAPEKKMNESPQYYVIFATRLEELQKQIPAERTVSYGILLRCMEKKLEEQWLESMATWERANTINQVLCIFRLSDMDWSSPPLPSQLMNGEAFDYGVELHPATFFGRSKPWKTYIIRRD